MPSLHIRAVSPEALRRWKMAATAKGVTLREFVLEAMEEAVPSPGGPKRRVYDVVVRSTASLDEEHLRSGSPATIQVTGTDERVPANPDGEEAIPLTHLGAGSGNAGDTAKPRMQLSEAMKRFLGAENPALLQRLSQ